MITFLLLLMLLKYCQTKDNNNKEATANFDWLLAISLYILIQLHNIPLFPT